jgi:hypothetical protein
MYLKPLFCAAFFLSVPAFAVAQSPPIGDAAATSNSGPAHPVADKQAVISRAREAYYDLRKEGLVTFQCTVTPNWDDILQDKRKEDPAAADATEKILSQLHFVAYLGSDGKVRLTHNDLIVQNQRAMDGLRQIYDGMAQMTTGFFDSWSLFTMGAPFPEVDGEYDLETTGPEFRLTYAEGSTDVVTTMHFDFSISSMKVTMPAIDATVRPEFTNTAKGFLLSGYDGTYQTNTSTEPIHLKASVDYQEVDGLQLVRTLYITGNNGAVIFAEHLAFSECQVTKK